jgi:methylated-DNA-[protein]-cysteine S-methyltransferase
MIVTVTARFTSASCARTRRNATVGIRLNLGLDSACFLGDETGRDAMSEAIQHYHVFETAMGFCAIAWSDAGVARFQLPTKTAEATERLMHRRASGAEPGAPPEDIAAVVEAAKRYFGGEETDFSQVQLDLASQDAFFAQIYDALRRVGWGRTTTYGALAKEVGAGREAARGVGEAMAKNPTPLIIPCHRVLAAGGKIGGFSAPGGSKTKTRMLELEGVRLGPPEAAQQTFVF